MSEEYNVKGQSLHFLPELLTQSEANTKARPLETDESRAKRVADMKEWIKADGQTYPVLVVEVTDNENTWYEYIDGGCRVDAIAAINAEKAENEEPTLVWCTVVDGSEDLYKLAVTGNIHRNQNNHHEIALIIRDIKERHAWTGHGGDTKVAAYLGMDKARVSNYNKLLRAPKLVLDKLASGEIASLDAAMKLLAVPGAVEETAERAQEIAKEEAKKAAEQSGKEFDETQPVTVTSRHAADAAREVAATKSEEGGNENKTISRTRAQCIDLFGMITNVVYPEHVVQFAEYFTKQWFAGVGSDQDLIAMFDAAVGMEGDAKRLDKCRKAVEKQQREEEKAAEKAKAAAEKAKEKAKAEREKAREKAKVEKEKAKADKEKDKAEKLAAKKKAADEKAAAIEQSRKVAKKAAK